MPAKRELSMRQLRYVLRLHHDGVSAREIGRRLAWRARRSRTAWLPIASYRFENSGPAAAQPLSAIPEPSSWSLLGVGFAVLSGLPEADLGRGVSIKQS